MLNHTVSCFIYGTKCVIVKEFIISIENIE
jgi:hypothetical protein